jgi:hypothetical protein
MPSKTYYRKKAVFMHPKLTDWFNEKKNFKNDPEMNSFRQQFTMIAGNDDPDWSLFRAKMRGDVSCLREEVDFVDAHSGLRLNNGKPIYAGLGRQMNLLEIVGLVKPNPIGKNKQKKR